MADGAINNIKSGTAAPADARTYLDNVKFSRALNSAASTDQLLKQLCTALGLPRTAIPPLPLAPHNNDNRATELLRKWVLLQPRTVPNLIDVLMEAGLGDFALEQFTTIHDQKTATAPVKQQQLNKKV